MWFERETWNLEIGLYFFRGTVMGHPNLTIPILVTVDNMRNRWVSSIYPLPDGGHVVYNDDLSNGKWQKIEPHDVAING